MSILNVVRTRNTNYCSLEPREKKILPIGALVIGFPCNGQLVNMENIASDHKFDYSANGPITQQILNSIALQVRKIFLRSDSGCTKIELPFEPMPMKDVSKINCRWSLQQCRRILLTMNSN